MGCSLFWAVSHSPDPCRICFCGRLSSIGDGVFGVQGCSLSVGGTLSSVVHGCRSWVGHGCHWKRVVVVCQLLCRHTSFADLRAFFLIGVVWGGAVVTWGSDPDGDEVLGSLPFPSTHATYGGMGAGPRSLTWVRGSSLSFGMVLW